MYLCLDCERVFDDPTAYLERHNLDTAPYEQWTGCPYCGGAYVDAMACDLCNHWITDEYIELKDGTVICEHCYEIKNVE